MPTSEQLMTEREWCEYLSTSSDPDDQSLWARLRIVEYLKAKREPLNQREEHWLALLQGMNAVELDYLRQPVANRIGGERPCWPRWHWPEELEELLHRTIGHEQH